MNHIRDYEIHYSFQGEQRYFTHQASQLCETDALHFATLHAGVGTTNGSFTARPVRLAMLQAEGLGVTQVRWKCS